MEYICPRCNYTSTRKDYFIKHINRKIVCPATKSDVSLESLQKLYEKTKNADIKCPFCPKKFTHCTSLSRHKKICVGLIDNTKALDKMKQEIRNEIMTELGVGKTVNTNNGTINNIQNQNNNITIQLKSFGFENISHLETDIKYLTHCLVNKDVTGLLENIHCDANYPENHNVRIKSLKKEFMETFVDGRWIVTDQEETLDELLNKGYRILNFFSYRNKDSIVADEGLEEYREMRMWLESLYDDHKIRKPLKRKMLILFMNNKTLFLEKEDNKRAETQPSKNHKLEIKPVEVSTSHIEEDDESDYIPSDAEELSPEEAAKYTIARFDPVEYAKKLQQEHC